MRGAGSMKRIVTTAVAITLLQAVATSSQADAQAISGNQLLEICLKLDYFSDGYCGWLRSGGL